MKITIPTHANHEICFSNFNNMHMHNIPHTKTLITNFDKALINSHAHTNEKEKNYYSLYLFMIYDFYTFQLDYCYPFNFPLFLGHKL